MSMNSLILESVDRSAREVFSTMLGVDLCAGEIIESGAAPEANCEVVSLIGVAGAWAGTGSISCTAATACKICSQMLMTEAPSVNEDVLDAVAELTNMIIGNVKTDLEARVGPLGLSIPTVVFGRNFTTKTAGAPGALMLRFQWDGEIFSVRICLVPDNRESHPAPHPSLEKAAASLAAGAANA